MIIPYHENLEKKRTPIEFRELLHRSNLLPGDFILPSGELVQEMDAHQNSYFTRKLYGLIESTITSLYYEDEKTVVINDQRIYNPFGEDYNLPRTNDDVLLGINNLAQRENNDNTDNADVINNKIKECGEQAKRCQEEINRINISDKMFEDKESSQYKDWEQLMIFLFLISQKRSIEEFKEMLPDIREELTYKNMAAREKGKKHIYESFKKLCESSPNIKKPFLELRREELSDYKDILVGLFGIDIISTAMPYTIVTSRSNIYESFFNYYIKEYKIQQVPKMMLDKKQNKFVRAEIDNNLPFIMDNKERAYKEEIELIRKNVPYEHVKKYIR